MTLDEAIRVLKICVEDAERLNEPNTEDAIKLGIEALKRVKHIRTFHKPNPLDILPGETKD